jgi:signal transduction histidine kinase
VRTLLENIQYKGKVRTGYILGFFLLLISFLLTLFANNELIENARLVAKTHNIVSNLEAMISKVKDGEIGFRGYLITGDQEYLQPFFGSRRSVDSIYRETRAMVTNEEQKEDLDSLKSRIEKKYSHFESALDLVRHNNQVYTANMLDSFKKSKYTMDAIMKEVQSMQEREEVLIADRDGKLKKITDTVQSFVLASMVIAFFLVIFGFSFHVKENRERMYAENKVRSYQDELRKRIDELAEANKELIEMRREEKFAATGRIARTIAHEIRNPLTNINLAADQLSSEMPPEDDNTGFLFEMITRNSNRINQLISELLNSTKFAELNFVKTSVNELLDDTLKLAQDRILLSNVRLEKNYAPDVCQILVDREKMKIAFLNIIINALEAMQDKDEGKLYIETTRDGDKCIVIIADNGTGMAPEDESKLFEPYFTTKQKGNGLGLTNTQNIILNHKGSIHVHSIKGEGTKFIITLNIDKKYTS